MTKKITIIFIVSIIIIFIVFIAVRQTSRQPEQNNLRQRLNAAGLPALISEGTVLHTHQHLDIYINGKSVSVPANIGIPGDNSFISPIHTHDFSGIIHVESPIVRDFTLGQFFDVWGVKLTDNCIGGYCTNADENLRVYSNGELVTNIRSLLLTKHQEIVITFGKPSQEQKPIPTTYEFPLGY